MKESYQTEEKGTHQCTPACPEEESLNTDRNTIVLPKTKMTFITRLQQVKSNITVEPALAFFVMPNILAFMAIQNLNLEKACRVNLVFTDEACTALMLRQRANFNREEDEVQKLIATVQAWKSIPQTLMPTVLILFIGAWSDKTGRRKICMLLPILAEFLTCLLNIISTFFFYEIPVEWTVFMEILFPCLTCGWYCMFVGAYSYVGDITTKETRTFRLGILSLCSSVGFPIGMGLSGVLLKKLGYYGVFGISATIKFLNLCYVFFCLEDHTWLVKKDEMKTEHSGIMREFFDFKSLEQSLSTIFKKGLNNRRLRICLVLAVVSLNFATLWGEMGIMYIFVRYQFNWNEVKYSIYSTYSFITHAIGTIFSLSVISKRWKADDAVLGIISTCSKICGACVLVFAKTDYQIYMSPLLEILNGTTLIAMRSIASKMVTYQELGKVFSLFGLAETMVPLIFAPLYSKIYILTLHVLPGAVFLISIAITVPAVVIFGWFYRQHKKDSEVKGPETPAPSIAKEEETTSGVDEASQLEKEVLSE